MIKVPDNTSINLKEYKPDQGIIPFAPELVDFIVQGKKVATYRFGLKYDYLTVGDSIDIQNSETKEIVARAKITGKSTVKFADLPLKTAEHEAYESKQQQRTVLSGYYAYLGRPIDDDDIFLKFDFELIK